MKPLLRDVEQANIETRQATERLSGLAEFISAQLGVIGKNGIISTTVYDELEEIKQLLK
jgi:hypothetical protein